MTNRYAKPSAQLHQWATLVALVHVVFVAPYLAWLEFGQLGLVLYAGVVTVTILVAAPVVVLVLIVAINRTVADDRGGDGGA